MLKKDNLFGAIVYYDGQHNDARMNLSLALTAIRYGGTLVNHVMVSGLNKVCIKGEERIAGVHCIDILTGDEWDIKAKCVVNATGSFTDKIRQMDDPYCRRLVQPSSGVHIILPDYYSPSDMGLLDPSTSDGRVIFFLPWQKHTIAGTTEGKTKITHHPSPSEEDIDFILSEVKHYLSPNIAVRRGDVLSSWSGIRPLVLDPEKKESQAIARNHVIEVSKTGLFTVAGGKWTTYRLMAEETVNALVKTSCDLEFSKSCRTKGFLLEGAKGWSPTMFIRLVQDFGLESEVAQHLSDTYGDKAFIIAKMASITGKNWPVVGKRIHDNFPYIESEVRYAIREYACSAVDMIGRRLRMAFLNADATLDSLPRILTIMCEELNWSEEERTKQHDQAIHFLNHEMGMRANKLLQESIGELLTEEEVQTFISQFSALDTDSKGYISMIDLRQSLQESCADEDLSEDKLHEIFNEVDLNKNGIIEIEEYMKLMGAVKKGVIFKSRLTKAAEMAQERPKIEVNKSGGGV